MAAAVRLWQEALQQIELLGASRAAEPDQQGPQNCTLCVQPAADFFRLPKLNPTVWKKLVVDLQVPKRLGQAAASASDPSAPRACAATSAVGLLLAKARQEGSVPYFTSPNSLAQALFLQLSQSGFMAVLPRMLDAAALALTAAQHESGLADVPQSSKASSKAAGSGRSSDGVGELQDTARNLLQVSWDTMHSWPRQPLTLQLREALALPVLRLCMAALQHCSRCADLLPADAAAAGLDPPTRLEQLADAACRTGKTVIVAWAQHRPDFDSVMLHSADALRAVCMLMLAPAVCPEGFTQDVTGHQGTGSSSSRQRHRGKSQQAANSLAAWQFACAHSPALPAAQQRALQQLGCSGRLFMFMAGQDLASPSSSSEVLLYCFSYTRIADALGKQYLTTHHSMLDRGDAEGSRYRQQLAEALGAPTQDQMQHQQQQPQHQQPQQQCQQPCDAAEPLSRLADGCGSTVLPCAPLLWLMPAVLLQWLERQPGPTAAVLHSGSRAEPDPAIAVLQTPIDVVRASAQVLGGYACLWAKAQGTMLQLAATSPEQQGAMFSRAEQAAAALRAKWAPPVPCVVQLLHLFSSTAARVMALGAQGSSSAATHRHGETSGRSSAGSCSSRGQPCTSRNSLAGSPCASGKQGDDITVHDIILDSLSAALPGLLQMASSCLWSFRSHGPCTASTGSSGGRLPASLNTVAVSGGQDQAAGLRSLCGALQQTLPQLSSLMQTTIRTLAGTGDDCRLAVVSCGVPQEFVVNQGLLLAVGLQPGSPALRALLSLCFTQLKAANLLLSSPSATRAGMDNVTEAGRCVHFVTGLVSLVLQATFAVHTQHQAAPCSGSSGSSCSVTADAAVVAALFNSGVCRQAVRFPAEGLSAISSVCSTSSESDAAATTSRSRSSSSSGRKSSRSSSAAGSYDALAVVPWLACLGRCCLARARLVKRATCGDGSDAAPGVDKLPLKVLVDEAVALLPGWLQLSSVSAQLSAAGYDVQPVLELLQPAAVAQLQADLATPRADVLPKKLQRLGLALSSLPVSCACNNPLCSSLAGSSEQQLVTGSGRSCSGCRAARYCSPACQTMHWQQHKPVCRTVARVSCHNTSGAGKGRAVLDYACLAAPGRAATQRLFGQVVAGRHAEAQHARGEAARLRIACLWTLFVDWQPA